MTITETFTRVLGEGVNNALYDLFYQVMNKLTHFKAIQGMVITLDDVAGIKIQRPSRMKARFVTTNELLAVQNKSQLQLSNQFIDEAKRRGDYCMGIFEGKKLVSYGWYSSTPTNITNDLVIHFRPTYVYMYKGFTHPDYRGKRLHALGKISALKQFSKLGFSGLISYVEKNNFSSIKSNLRMGCRPIGDVHVLKFRNKYLCHNDKKCLDYLFSVQSAKA